MAVVVAPDVAPVEQEKGGGGKGRRSNLRDHLTSLGFLVPGAILLLAIVIYPAIVTVRDSFLNETATKAVGFANYKALFSTADILISLRNNVIWVIVFPFVVTVIGLVLAVLTERIKWSTAFKTVIFIPIVFSVTASSLIYTQIFALDPHIGVVNAVIQTVDDWIHPPGSYPLQSGQTASSLIASGGVAGPGGSIDSSAAAAAGGTVKIGITGISPNTLSALGALPAKAPTAASGHINGLVWRAFSPSNPTNTTEVFPDEVGLPNLEVALINSHGDSTATVHTDSHGNFSFSNVGAGQFHVRITASNFQTGFSGIAWLGRNP